MFWINTDNGFNGKIMQDIAQANKTLYVCKN